MNRHLGWALALALSTAAAPCVSAAELVATANIAERGLSADDFPRVLNISPDVYVYEGLLTADGETFTTTSMFVVTSAGVLVADGQRDEPSVRRMISDIASVTSQPIRYVVVASDHGDHVAGNNEFKKAFPDVIFVSSPASQAVIARNAALPPVTETVAEKRTLQLGEKTIEILNLGRGHTGGDLVVHLPEPDVVFMGELYLHHLFPSMVTGYPSEWAATLKRAEQMDATWYIPGHGFTDDAQTMKANLVQAREVIEHIMAEAKRLKAAGHACESRSDCAAAAHAQWGPYTELTAYAAQAPRALARAYMELDGKLPNQ